MNNIKRKGVNPCTGCSICSVACPNNAIRVELTNEGFYEPIIDNKLCVDCGLCIKNCYKYDSKVSIIKADTIKSYSAINLDDKELYNSTSGGAAGVLARECIKQGYKVLGVAYDYDKNIAITQIASAANETEQFKGSKYFQSYTEKAFKQALTEKTEQKYAVFGTPCQIYAVNKYITSKDKKDKFILVDIFCHGCPSLNLWAKYLEFIKQKIKQKSFDKIEFRSKIHGWHEYCYSFKNNNIQHNTKKVNDHFYTMFFNGNIFCSACYSCKMRSTIEYTDIRLGDFWGYQYDTNAKGVSAVVTYTTLGDELFKSVKDHFIVNEHTFEEVIKFQSYGEVHKLNEQKRCYELELLASDKSMTEIMKKCKKLYSYKKRGKILVRSFVRILPNSIYNNLRKMMHILSYK